MYNLGDYDIDFSGASKSRLLTFLRNEFGELLTSFCVDIGTVFHRTKADIHYLIPSMLTAAILLLLKPIIQIF